MTVDRSQSEAVMEEKTLTSCFWPRLCKNVFERVRCPKPDWKSRFYAESTSADVPINFRFNVDADTSILARRFYTLWADSIRRLTVRELHRR
jgi:hypothetical protein